MQVSLISSITTTHNPNHTIDSIEELATGPTVNEEKPIARSNSSKGSLPETNTTLFPGCSQWEIDEVRLILVADKRSKEDIQLLSRKLKDNPLIKTLIKRLKLEDDQEAYRQLFKLLKLEEYPEGHRVYEQKDLSNSKSYLVFQGEVLKIQHLSPEEKNDQKTVGHLKTQVSNLGSRIEFDDLSPGLSPGVGGNFGSKTPKARQLLSKSRSKVLDLKEIPEEREIKKVFTQSMKREQRFSALLTQQTQDKEHQNFVNALELFIKKGLPTTKTNFGDKAESVKNIIPGGHFGQKALWSMQKRDHTVITRSKCEFIVLTADGLKAIKKTLETNKKRLVQFVSACFPLIDFENESRVFNHIMESFTCKIFSHGQSIEVEGKNTSDCFYIIYQGQCEILKKIVLENNTPVTSPFHDIKTFFALTPNNIEHMNILTLNEGSFFGDEVLFSHRSKNSYTIKVLSPEVKVLAFDKNKFLAKAPKDVLVQLRDHYLQRQEKNCDILVQNLFLRGYSLDKQAFLEENKIVLEPLKESKFRTFYHQARNLRESQASSISESHLTLDNIKERVNEQYAHKLRLANSGSKTPRITLEPLGGNTSPRPGSIFTSMTPKESLSARGNFSPRVGGMQSPNYYLGSQGSKSQWPNLEKNSKGGQNSNDNSKTMEHSSSLNNYLALFSERAKKLDPIIERRDSEKHHDYKPSHTESDQAPDLVRLKFLQGEESKKGLKNFLKSRSHKNNTKDDGIFKGKVDYAEIMKTHYRTKFIGNSSQNDSYEHQNNLKQDYKVYTEEKIGKPQLAKPQLHIDLPEPMLDSKKMVTKAEPVNIHMKHDKRKLNPLQRCKNRTDIVFKSPRNKE